MKAKEFIPASKPRNFVAKNQKTAGAGAHKDKKRAEKQGDVKHKGKQYDEDIAEAVKKPNATTRHLRDYPVSDKDVAKPVKKPEKKKPEQGVAEGLEKNLSVQQLATISDEALDKAYGYGRSNPGNTFGWQANLMSAAYAKKMIDAGVTDIEKISDAIHKGWNVTAQKFVQNPDQFDDTEKLRQAGKLEAKLAQRAKLMKINYGQLDNEEQEKDRVVARALLKAIKGQQGVAERIRDPEDWDEGSTEPGNNFAVYINGKKWKVFPGPYGAYADSPEEEREFYRLKDMARRKSASSGKKWEVFKTGEKATESVSEDTNIPFNQCPQCGGEIVHKSAVNEKQDACYHKVKSRYKVWPSAYASGALVQCRKKGASNWGKKK